MQRTRDPWSTSTSHEEATMNLHTEPTPPALRLEKVAKRFGPILAVQDFSLEVAPGELVALVGPSGCGKTTVLRLIAGLEIPDQGTIDIQGRRVAGGGVWVPPEKRRVGLMFQDYALFPHMTVAQNVAFGLKHWPQEARAQRVAEMLAKVQLTHLADRYPHEISGGEQQRVALARALAPEPQILLLDEPFSNLDAGLRTQVREEIRDLLHSLGITTLFVTHDQEEALFMGDRVAVLHAGRLEQVGTPEEVFHRPATPFVAKFFGPTAFIQGRVVAEGLETELGFLPQTVNLPVGTSVEILVRPDDLVFVPDPQGPARILRRVFQGMHHMYQILLPSGRRIYALSVHNQVFEPGTAVQVELQPGHDLACFPSGEQPFLPTEAYPAASSAMAS